MKLARLRFALWWSQVPIAALLLLVGLDVPRIGAPMIGGAIASVVLGTAWIVAVLVRRAPGETAVPVRRKQIALTVSVSAPLLLILSMVGMSRGAQAARWGASREWKAGDTPSPQRLDPEYGWAPYAPPDVVGQRLEKIDPNRPHVLLMGDSIIYGANVSADEHVGRALEPLLPGYQVLNGAVSGYSIDQYLLLLQRYVPIVKPKLIIVGVFTGNDFQMTAREFGWGNNKPLFRVENGELRRADVAGACIDRLARSLFFRILWRDRHLATRTIEYFCKPASLGRGDAERAIARTFDAIDQLAAKHRAELLYVLLPVDSELSPYDTDRYLYVSRHFDLWRILSSGRRRSPFDFAGDLFAKGADPRPLFQEDHAHLVPLGHQKLAAALAREIARRQLLPQ